MCDVRRSDAEAAEKSHRASVETEQSSLTLFQHPDKHQDDSGQFDSLMEAAGRNLTECEYKHSHCAEVYCEKTSVINKTVHFSS